MITKYAFLFSLIVASIFCPNSIHAQMKIVVKQINGFIDVTSSSPKDALVNPGNFSTGNAIQFYYGAELPFLYLRYGKNNGQLIISVFMDHEKANFQDPIDNDLNAKLTSYGIRIHPFDGKKPKYDNDGNFLLAFIISGIYADFGFGNSKLTQIPNINITRNTKIFGCGWSPKMSQGKKINLLLDCGFRNYSWNNISNTKSSVFSLHAGIGIGFNF